MFENLNFWQFVGLYLVLQIVYVVLNTVTNIAKIKCSKLIASITSAICYGFYVIVVVATASNQSILVKMALTAITNIVGVYVGMWVMEKMRKDKLWKIEATLTNVNKIKPLKELLTENKLSFNTVQCENGDIIFNIYAKTQKESSIVKQLLNGAGAHYIIHESVCRL